MYSDEILYYHSHNNILIESIEHSRNHILGVYYVLEKKNYSIIWSMLMLGLRGAQTLGKLRNVFESKLAAELIIFFLNGRP